MFSPLFTKRTDLQLESPGVARLLVELPIRFRNRSGPHEPARIEVLQTLFPHSLPDPIPHPCGIHSSIDDEMRDMNVVRTELSGGALSNRPQAEFGAGECGIADPAAQTGSCASEEDTAAAARQHMARRLSRAEKPRIAGHFPDLAEHAFGGLE